MARSMPEGRRVQSGNALSARSESNGPALSERSESNGSSRTCQQDRADLRAEIVERYGASIGRPARDGLRSIAAGAQHRRNDDALPRARIGAHPEDALAQAEH